MPAAWLARAALCAVLVALPAAAGVEAISAAPAVVTAPAAALAEPAKKEIAMELVSSAENSSLDWRAQFSYLEDIHDGRGYTGGIIGFTSGTGDMLELVRSYSRAKRGNPLRRFLPALRRVNGTDSHRGLGPRFARAWRRAARDPSFRTAQQRLRDRAYFNPAVKLAAADGLGALGQFCYYDAAVVHGFEGLESIRDRAVKLATTPASGGYETVYLDAFLDERVAEMRKEAAHEDVSRIEAAQRRFLREGNLDLHTPLVWAVYGDDYAIDAAAAG